MGRKWVRAFKDRRTSYCSGRPSVITNELKTAQIWSNVQKNRRFTISSLSDNFLQVSKSVLHEIATERLNYWKLCSRWVTKMQSDLHKTFCITTALTFLGKYCHKGDELLCQIVTDDETWPTM